MSNNKIQFYLKDNGRELREVILRFSFGYKLIDNLTGNYKYKPLIYNTGVKTTIQFWDEKLGIPSKSKDLVKALEIREKLEIVYSNLKVKGIEVTPELLTREMDIVLGRKKEEKTITRVYDFIYDYYLEREEDKEEHKFKFAYNTRRNYRALNKVILAFENAQHITLFAEKLDKETFLAFQTMCQEKAKKNNTAWTHVKNLIAALRAIGRKYKIDVFDPAKELLKKEVISDKLEDKIYLDFDEIQRIIDFSPPNEHMREVKLILLTLIFSGARYSDIQKVKPNNNYSKSSLSFRYAHFITSKNPTEVVVPFLKPLEDAWKESKRKSLVKMEASKFNEAVKDLCRLAGFTELKKLAYTDSSGEKQFEVKAHFKFVSSHIGRRSFITNFLNVVSPMLISKITGHQFKMSDVIFKYNKITPLKSAVLFMKFAKKLYDDEDWRDEFPIKLVA